MRLFPIFFLCHPFVPLAVTWTLGVAVTYAQESPSSRPIMHEVAVSFGMQRSAERDEAYSPLIFGGAMPALGVHYRRRGARSSDHVNVALATGRLENRFGAEMPFFNAGIFTYKFYHRRDAEKTLQFGWSNQNVVSVRTFADADNFNPRADVHTTFGPAIQYRLTPKLLQEKLQLVVQAHIQAIGFLIGSDYVSPYPSGFTDRSRSGVAALWHSARLLYPGAMWHWGMWPQLQYRTGAGSRIGLSYRYDMVVLDGQHRSSGSRGQYFLTLIMPL